MYIIIPGKLKCDNNIIIITLNLCTYVRLSVCLSMGILTLLVVQLTKVSMFVATVPSERMEYSILFVRL